MTVGPHARARCGHTDYPHFHFPSHHPAKGRRARAHGPPRAACSRQYMLPLEPCREGIVPVRAGGIGERSGHGAHGIPCAPARTVTHTPAQTSTRIPTADCRHVPNNSSAPGHRAAWPPSASHPPALWRLSHRLARKTGKTWRTRGTRKLPPEADPVPHTSRWTLLCHVTLLRDRKRRNIALIPTGARIVRMRTDV